MLNYSKYTAIIWVIAFIAIIIGSLNNITTPPSEYYADKVIHFFAYLFITFLMVISFKNKTLIFILFVITIAVSGGIELMQENLPYREGSILDFIANTGGSLTGLFIAGKIKQKLKI